MTSSELKDLLRTLADDGGDSVDLAEHALIPRIQRRRRRRTTISVASGLAAVVAIGAIAYGVQPGDDQPQVAASPPAELSTSGVPACGQLPSRRAEVDSPLRLTMTQSVLTSNTDGWSAKVATTLTNTTSKSMKLTSSPSTALYLAENGKVVSRPTVLDGKAIQLVLQPGQTHTFSSVVNIQRCDPASEDPGQPFEPPLTYGSYELYGTHSISQHQDIWNELNGGPWPVTLK